MIKHHLMKYFTENFKGLNHLLYITEHMIYKHNRKFHDLLSKHAVSSDFYLSGFFLTLFTYSL